MNFKYFLYEADKTAVQPKTKAELMKIIKDTIKEQGNNCDLNFIDTSLIKNMSGLFYKSYFNGDISKWNVLKVDDHISIFNGCPLEVYPQYQPKFND